MIMVNYATKRGIALPNNINFSLQQTNESLVSNYNTITKTIQPATVESIQFIDNYICSIKEEHKWYKTPIFSKCLFIAIGALICLISVGLLPSVNEKNQAAGILASSGMTLLYNLLFICSASLLGVMFYLLKTISDKIKNYTLLPVDAIEVNSTIIIGLISGFIISELFNFDIDTIASSIEMQKMTLALLGGFSSDAIFSTLQAIVNKVKALFSVNS